MTGNVCLAPPLSSLATSVGCQPLVNVTLCKFKYLVPGLIKSFQGLGHGWYIQLGEAMVMRVITNMVLMDWMKRSISSGTTGSKKPILDSKQYNGNAVEAEELELAGDVGEEALRASTTLFRVLS